MHASPHSDSPPRHYRRRPRARRWSPEAVTRPGLANGGSQALRRAQSVREVGAPSRATERSGELDARFAVSWSRQAIGGALPSVASTAGTRSFETPRRDGAGFGSRPSIGSRGRTLARWTSCARRRRLRSTGRGLWSRASSRNGDADSTGGSDREVDRMGSAWRDLNGQFEQLTGAHSLRWASARAACRECAAPDVSLDELLDAPCSAGRRIAKLPGGRGGWSPSAVRRWARPAQPEAGYAAIRAGGRWRRRRGRRPTHPLTFPFQCERGMLAGWT